MEGLLHIMDALLTGISGSEWLDCMQDYIGKLPNYAVSSVKVQTFDKHSPQPSSNQIQDLSITGAGGKRTIRSAGLAMA